MTIAASMTTHVKNKRPLRHRAAHQRVEAHRLALFHKFEKAFAPRASATIRIGSNCVPSSSRGSRSVVPSPTPASPGARVVDHIKSVWEYPRLRLDPSNLQSLCWPCHKPKNESI